MKSFRSMLIYSIFLFVNMTVANAQNAPPPPIDKKLEKPDRGDRSLQIGIGISYSLMAQALFPSVSSASPAFNYILEVNFENSFALELDVRKLSPMSFGFIVGLIQDSDHKLSGAKVTSSLGTVTGTGNDTKLSVTTIYASLAYRKELVYIPFGLNYSLVKITGGGDVLASNGIGAQFGLGGYFNKQENTAIEATLRYLPLYLGKYRTTTNTIDYGSGAVSLLNISGKYLF